MIFKLFFLKREMDYIRPYLDINTYIPSFIKTLYFKYKMYNIYVNVKEMFSNKSIYSKDKLGDYVLLTNLDTEEKYLAKNKRLFRFKKSQYQVFLEKDTHLIDITQRYDNEYPSAFELDGDNILVYENDDLIREFPLYKNVYIPTEGF